MERSSLKLTVQKGPREGEILHCRPGSVIRIGRVLKGNTFAIKDAGISSKHLLIEFNNGIWEVFDLDTSNGTFLNEIQLRGMTAFDLKDGDVIKIGEYTSLKVNIEEESKPVKDSRKIGEKASVDVEISEDFDVENGERQLRRNPRRGVTSKAKPPKPTQLSVPTVVRNIRGKSNLEAEKRGEPENVASIAENRTRRGAPRRTKTSKDDPLESFLDPDSENQNVANSPNELLESVPIPVSEAPKIPERSKLQKETCNESSDRPAAIDKNSVPINAENGFDLEKMTLGEWFDYLEVYLPKKIYETTEEIISSMRERAKKFNEFISVQNDLKSKFSVA